MVGVDEVGRGCWAGPLLVVAARATSELPTGLTDSKLLTGLQRENLIVELLRSCEFGEGWVSAEEIDKNGLATALRLGISRSLKALNVLEDEKIILDGKVNYCVAKFKKAKCVVDADLLVPIVSAASVYAKVARDRFMQELSLKHPNYGFENHVGYGTRTHQQALAEFGILRGIHRQSYKPIAALIQ